MPSAKLEPKLEQVVHLVRVFIEQANKYEDDSRTAQEYGWTIKWSGKKEYSKIEVSSNESFTTLRPLLETSTSFLKKTEPSPEQYGDSHIRELISSCLKRLIELKLADSDKTKFDRKEKKTILLTLPSSDIDRVEKEIRKRWSQLQQTEQNQESSSKSLTYPNNVPPSGAYNWFVGRDELLEKIHLFFHKEAQEQKLLPRVALYGMAGVGKSELAKQYARRYAETYKGGIVFVDARGEEEQQDGAIFDEMVHIAQQLTLFIGTCIDESLAEEAERFETPFQFLQWYWVRWVNDPQPVLIILDDLVNYANAVHTLDEILPPQYLDRFKVLITTRKRFTPSLHYIDVNKLSQFDAYELLSRILGENDSRMATERSTAYRLIDFLEYLPLGLELTGRYLFAFPEISLAQAFDDLEQRKLQAEELLKSKPGLSLKVFQKWWRPGKANERDRDMTSSWGVYAALQLSWELLQQNAQILAYILSLYAPKPIPNMSILFRIFEANCQGVEPGLEEMELRKILKRNLIDGSFVKERSIFLDTHQLVRKFFTAKFEELAITEDGRRIAQKIRKDFCKRISLKFHEASVALGDHSKSKIDIYLPHVIQAIQISKEYPDALSLIDRAYKLLTVGNSYYEEGANYRLCLSYIEEAIVTAAQGLSTKINNPPDHETIHLLYVSFQYFEERLKQIYDHILNLKEYVEKVFTLLDSFKGLYQNKLLNNNIYPSTFFSDQSWRECEKRFFFSSFVDTLGDPPDVAEEVRRFWRLEASTGDTELVERIDEQGRVFFEQQQLSEDNQGRNNALSCIRGIAESREQTVPHNHFKYLATQFKLAEQLSCSPSNRLEGFQMYEKLFRTMDVSFPDKPHLVEPILDDLASYALSLKLYEKAENYYKQILSIYDLLYSRESLARLDVVMNLAEAYVGQGNYDAAINTIVAEFDSMVMLLTKDSPNRLAEIYGKLANYCLLAGRLDELEHYAEQQSLLESKRSFRHKLWVFFEGRLVVLQHMEQLEQWKTESEEFYKLFTNTHHEPPYLHDVVKSIAEDQHLVSALKDDEQFPHRACAGQQEHLDYLALCCKQILRERRAIHGEESPRYCSTLHKTAQILSISGQFEEALSFYEEAIPLLSRLHRDHELIAIVRKNCAEISFRLNDYERAISHLQHLIPIQAALLDSDLWNVNKSLQMHAASLFALERYEEAVVELKLALAVAIDRRKGWSKETREALYPLLELLWALNRVDEATLLMSELEVKEENDKYRVEFEIYKVLSQKLEDNGQQDEAIIFIDRALACVGLMIEKTTGTTKRLKDLVKRKKQLLRRFGRADKIKSAVEEQYHLTNDAEFLRANAYYETGEFQYCKLLLERTVQAIRGRSNISHN